MEKKMTGPSLEELFTAIRSDLDRYEETPAINRLRARLEKKAIVSSQAVTRKRAIDKFLAINESIAGFKPSLPDQIVNDAKYYLTVVLERYTTRQDDTWIQNPLHLQHLMDLWAFGPGASNGVKGTHCAEKIYQAMTCTNGAEPLVRQLRGSNYYLRAFDSTLRSSGYTLVSGSRITTVPKNQDVDRTIAIEPSGNMALQLAAGRYLEGALRLIGLDIKKQQFINKELARKGSIDGSLATIDLSSASDMFTPELVRLLMPPEWYRLLMGLRSPVADVDGRQVTLNMISTMGNGFTFPLMTLLIVSLIYAYRASRHGPTLFVDWRNTAVFGDDIIIPSHEYAGFTELLEQAGLVVNHDKSYSTGTFRESCGGDYDNGVDITPFYVKTVSDLSAIHVVLNQLLLWGAKHRVCFSQSLTLLKSWVDKVHIVPEWYDPDKGVRAASVDRRFTYLTRIVREKPLKNGIFSMMLACGGYVSPGTGTDCCYTPRPNSTARFRVSRARLPKGFLDGRDPTMWDSAISSSIATDVACYLI